MNNKKNKLLKLISIKVVLISILFIVSFFIFALIAHEAVSENEKVFDDKVIAFFSSITTPGLIQVMKIFTFFGSSTFLFPAYIVMVAYFLIKKKFRYGIDIAIIALSSETLVQVLKLVFHRKRPDLPVLKGIATYSFPSGHTLSSFIFCCIIIFILFNGKWKAMYKWILSVFLIVFAVTIGISRIVLRAHYPTDVIASFCLGIIWTILSFWIFTFLNRKDVLSKKD
jgi:undecaprenyl-diphosphatase